MYEARAFSRVKGLFGYFGLCPSSTHALNFFSFRCWVVMDFLDILRMIFPVAVRMKRVFSHVNDLTGRIFVFRSFIWMPS